MATQGAALTTLCYLEQGDSLLMMHRIKKKHDVNQDKWIGIGGHALSGESPEDCLLREAFEETGLRLTDYRFRGLVTFVLKDVETEYMCLYTASAWEGELDYGCDEGVLEWVQKAAVTQLELWDGDRVFFRLLAQERPFFSLKLVYDGDALEECVLDGERMDWREFLKSGEIRI